MPVVSTVRLRVSLMLRLMMAASPSRGRLRMFSRIRSETITVSLTEKPTIVSSAATIVRSNS